jgi:hypothetical protein
MAILEYMAMQIKPWGIFLTSIADSARIVAAARRLRLV